MSLPNPIKYHVYTGQPLPDPWPYDYVLCRQGVVKRLQTRHFFANILVAAGQVAGLAEYPVNLAVLDIDVPRIPATWLTRVLEDARQAGSNGLVARPIEQMYHFHWKEGKWQVSRPKQNASAGQVSYKGGFESSIVLDLHSHHDMGAFFSGTDNRDEQGCRFYAVIGRIYTRPEIRLRVGIYGDWLELDPLDLFEGLGPFAPAGEDFWEEPRDDLRRVVRVRSGNEFRAIGAY